jgi:hypothetical protein
MTVDDLSRLRTNAMQMKGEDMVWFSIVWKISGKYQSSCLFYSLIENIMKSVRSGTQIILEKIAKNLEQLLRATRTSRLIAMGKFR